MPRPEKKAATSGGSGAAALETISAWSRPRSPRIGASTAASAAANSSSSPGGMVCPYWHASTYRRPVSIALATAARLASSCSRVNSDSMPARIFSHTRGTPKKPLGRTFPTTRTSCAESGQKWTCVPVWMGR